MPDSAIPTTDRPTRRPAPSSPSPRVTLPFFPTALGSLTHTRTHSHTSALLLQSSKRARETIGVELYAAQQTLSRLQTKLDQTNDALERTALERERAEDELRELQEWFETRAGEADEQRSAVDRYQQELDALNATLKHVEAHDREIKSEIAVTRTAAFAAEEAVGRLEKEKLEQDVLIDSLQATLKKLHLQAATLDALRLQAFGRALHYRPALDRELSQRRWRLRSAIHGWSCGAGRSGTSWTGRSPAPPGSTS